MDDHLVLSVDRLITSESLQLVKENGVLESSEGVCCSHKMNACTSIDIDDEGKNVEADEEPLINIVECRICQEEDVIKNLEIPCACSGSLKFAHRKCVQQWCNEKGDVICEICHQPFQPNYTAPPPVPHSEDTSDGSGELHDARLVAVAAAEQRLLDAEYDEYSDTNTGGAAFCRSAALILMALLLLRHAVIIGNGDDDDDDDISAFFSLFLLRVVGLLLPCYIMAWVVSIIQRRRRRQEEEAAVAPNEVAFLIQAGQHRGLHFATTPGPAAAPGPAATPNPEPVQ